MEIVRRNNYDEGTRTEFLVISIVEFLAMAGMCVLAYILRETKYFPIRQVRFQCSDASISESLDSGRELMSQFTFSADISYALIIVLSFCLPSALILLGEIGRWKKAPQTKLSFTICCAICKINVFLRRMVRFICVFVIGMLITLVFTDVIKIFVGRLRPNFLEECQVNRTVCIAAGPNEWFTDDVCLQTNTTKLRWARQSFPSLHSSVTAFSSVFMAIYWQSVIGHGMRCTVLGPLLSFGFIIMSLMCGLSRYALHYSHWTDVAVGFALGAVIAVYISVFTLKTFRENSEIPTGNSSPDHLPSFDTYNSSGFQYQRGKPTWHLTPWHLTAQNNIGLDTDEKIERLPEAAYYNVDLPSASNNTPDGILRRSTVRNPEPSRDIARQDYAY